MRKIQIGVIGSMVDTKINKKVISMAKKLGAEIASYQAVLLFGFEGDFHSLPEIAARSAEIIGGQTVAFIRGSSKADLKGLRSHIVVTGHGRGGGREFSLVLSCDGIICLAGGSGTLVEIAMAYQAGLPIVTIKGSGGWSGKLANKYIDHRKRIKVIVAETPKIAVKMILRLVKNKILV